MTKQRSADEHQICDEPSPDRVFRSTTQHRPKSISHKARGEQRLACPTAIFWGRADVCAATSMSPSELKRKVRSGEFPKPVPIGKRRKAWQRVEVVAWCEARVVAARTAST
ncbi:MAG: helix-turn-helix transcriptional regulator [Hyphomicrobiaceae bacterium]